MCWALDMKFKCTSIAATCSINDDCESNRYCDYFDGKCKCKSGKDTADCGNWNITATLFIIYYLLMIYEI